jgi:membrane-associated phospholipid phosphatase
MVMTDYETWQAVRRPYEYNQTFRAFCDDGESFSKGPFQLAAVAGFLTFGIFGNRRALRTAYQIGEGIISSGLIVQVLKHATGRQSPFKATTRTGRWRVLSHFKDYAHNTQEFDAMPSGHLQSLSTAFFIIMDNYPEQKWIPYLMYPGLAWVSMGLVSTGIHWWSDLPIALALSYSMSKVITRRNHPKSTKISMWSPNLAPGISTEGSPTLTAHWEF